MKQRKREKSIKQIIMLCFISILVLGTSWTKSNRVIATEIAGEEPNSTLAGEVEEPIQIEMNQSIEKYFDIGEEQVLLQQKIVVTTNKSENHKEEEKLQIMVPVLQGKMPETAILLVNGERVNQSLVNYDAQNGKLDIDITKEVGITNWDLAVETYKILYEYTGITAEPQEVTLYTTVNTKIEEKEEVQATDEKTITLNPIGEAVSIQGEITQEIYKGYLYEAKDNATSYDENYRLEISNFQNVEEVSISREKENFVYYVEGEKVEQDTNGSTYFTKTLIQKEDMIRILGEEGSITIQNEQGEIIAELTKDTQENEDGNLVVEYPEKEIKNIKIVTTKPVELGELKINNQKEIDANTGYTRQQIKQFEYLEKKIKANESIHDFQMKLLDTKSETKVQINAENLSTLKSNENVQLLVTLLSNNQEQDLYQNPVVDIVFPKEMTIDIKSITQLNFEDEMKIISTGIKEDTEGQKIVRITLEGEQSTYASNLKEGIQIAVIADISIPNTTPSMEKNITVYYTNENKQGEQFEVQCPVKINSKYGVLMVHKLENYNQAGESVETTDDKGVIAQVGNLSENNLATQTVSIINNYETPISQIYLIGKIDEGMDIDLQNVQILQDQKVEIYYAADSNIEKDSKEWTENLAELSQVKAFKLVIEEDLQPAEVFSISENLKILEQQKGKSASLTMQLGYRYLENEESVVSCIKLKTEEEETMLQKQELDSPTAIEASMVATAGGNYIKDGDMVTEGQGIKYTIKLKNNTDNDINNVVLEATNTNAIYYNRMEYEEDTFGEMKTKYKIDEDESLTSKILSVGTIKAGETAQISYQITVKEVEDNNQKVTGEIKLTADNGIEQTMEGMSNPIQQGDLKLALRYTLSEDIEKHTGEGYPIEMKVTNITQEPKTDILVNLPVCEGLVFSEDQTLSNTDDPTYGYDYIGYDNRVASFKIPEIKAGETISLYTQLLIEDLPLTEAEKYISEYFLATYQNTVYTSNEIEKTIYQAKSNIEVEQTSNITGNTVKDGDNIEFHFTIKNEGVVEQELLMVDTIPYGITINRIKMITANGEEDIEWSYQTVSKMITIGASETVQIIIEGSLEADEVNGNKIRNEMELKNPDIEVKSNTLEFTIEGKEDNSSGNEEENGNQNAEYSLSGMAWIDSNENGARESSESKLSNIPVIMIEETTGNEFSTTTGEDGNYYFDDLKAGKYIVMFQYDASRYRVTTYQKEEVAEDRNSDVIDDTIILNEKEVKVAKTKTLEISNADLENIDAGLVEVKDFDLALEKYISRVIVQNSAGTTVYSYDKSQLAKVEINSKNITNTNVIIEYTIQVTNQGDAAGYANEIIDYLPKDLTFSSEINKTWYQTTDGNLCTKELANQLINPGESKELTLTLTKRMTQNNTGTTTNKAEVSKTSNDYSLEDMNTTNDSSQAEVIISIRTGAVILYISLITTAVLTILVGVYLIKKKVL